MTTNTNFSDKDKSTYANILATLSIARDTTTQHWVTFLVTAQTALGLGLGFLMIQETKTTIQKWAVLIFAIVIPIFAVKIAQTTISIIDRERKWQQWFNFQLHKLSDGAIFPSLYHREQPSGPDDIKSGALTSFIVEMKDKIVQIWTIVGVACALIAFVSLLSHVLS